MEVIALHDIRKEVDAKYVGFMPNGGAIKPVHIAGGSLRCIYGKCNTSKGIKKLALVSDSKGNIPYGNEIEAIYKECIEDEKIEESVEAGSLESMRNVMQRMLSADKGVYVVKGLKDNMLSYSAGSKYFITKKSMYEDTGEFIGGLVRTYCPKLSDYLYNLLNKAYDPISILFSPVLSDETEEYSTEYRHEDIPAFSAPNATMQWYIGGLRAAGECLLKNFERHPNPLTQLRIFNFFCIFQIMRYITLLEAFYCSGSVRPILLDFSMLPPNKSSVARASEMSYTQMHKSINRFYAWGYSQQLCEDGYSIETLLSSVPVYDKNKTPSKAVQDELNTLWNIAKEHAAEAENSEEAYLAIGEAMYDMLALVASSHPVNFVKTLGTSAGILYPPDAMHPNKRFVISQDILEMLLRASVEPGEIISGQEIRERVWNRFGAVIGGSQFELDKLQRSGFILQVDEDALESNFAKFASMLENMDFAEIMADGILQIRLGGDEVR